LKEIAPPKFQIASTGQTVFQKQELKVSWRACRGLFLEVQLQSDLGKVTDLGSAHSKG
jgi:hypothetical protein